MCGEYENSNPWTTVNLNYRDLLRLSFLESHPVGLTKRIAEHSLLKMKNRAYYIATKI